MKSEFKKLKEEIYTYKKCSGLNIPKKTISAPGHGSLDAELFVIVQSLHVYNLKTPDC